MGTDLAMLFDVDGVLLDSGDLFRRVWSAWAAARALDATWVLAHTSGRRTADILDQVAPHLDPVTERRTLDAITREHLGEVRPVPGARRLLRDCGGLPWAIVTSGSRWFVHESFRANQLPVPAVAVYDDDVRHGKPSPEGYLAAARRLCVPACRCVVVEDAPYGIAAAKAAGCTVLAVATTHPPARLRGADACMAGLPTVEALLRLVRFREGRQRRD